MRTPLEASLNANLRDLRASATVEINEHSDALIAEGHRVFKLGLGQSPFPVPEPLVSALREHAAEKEYLPVRGLYELRRAIARYTERKVGIDRTPEDVIVGPGGKALIFLLQLVFEGEIIIPTPAWVSYGPQARILGRSVRFVRTRREEGWLLSADMLDRIGRESSGAPRIVVLNYPSSATGASYKPDELRAMAEIAQKHRLILLSDEIYGELHHKGEHVSIARWYPEGTIISTGLSKWCGASGWRLGALIIPEDLRWLVEAMATVASETFTSTSAPIQYAAISAFEGGDELERYLTNSRRVLAALGRWCARKLRAVGVDCVQPAGGFYLFPDFGVLRERLHAHDIRTSRQLCARLLEEAGLALLPGSEFGLPEEELTARLAYVDFDGARALEAVAVIPREQPLDEIFLKRHCRGVVAAIETLCRLVQAAGSS